jgi:hypothetical protein
MLSSSDQEQYKVLQESLLQIAGGRRRGVRLVRLCDQLDAIRQFAQRGDADDSKRCCVCGVCFLTSGIGINSHQLLYLTNRCKSSINGALKLMGYKIVSSRGDINPELVDALPNLRGDTRELRHWSVRAPFAYTPQTSSHEKKESEVVENAEKATTAASQQRELAAEEELQSLWDAADWPTPAAAYEGDDGFFLGL